MCVVELSRGLKCISEGDPYCAVHAKYTLSTGQVCGKCKQKMQTENSPRHVCAEAIRWTGGAPDVPAGREGAKMRTLDELISELIELRREIPSAGSAVVVGIPDEPFHYSQGEVLIAREEDEDEFYHAHIA